MTTRSDDPGLTLEKLLEIEAEARRRPVLQAVAIYDCEATSDSVIMLEHRATFDGVVLTFGMESGPVVRWFFKQKAMKWEDFAGWERGKAPDLEVEVAPINCYGFACVMSQKTFDTYMGLMTEKELEPTTSMILQPRVYDLNKDKRR